MPMPPPQVGSWWAGRLSGLRALQVADFVDQVSAVTASATGEASILCATVPKLRGPADCRWEGPGKGGGTCQLDNRVGKVFFIYVFLSAAGSVSVRSSIF
jgi:hypothetical protein